MQHEHLLRQGRELTAERAEELLKKADADPKDLESRLPLLSYHFFQRLRSKESAKIHSDLVLWLIENHPDSRVAGDPEATLYSYRATEAYGKAKALWLEQVKKHNKSALVQANAARFFLLEDPSTAEELLKQAQALEPTNAEWAAQLGRLYALRSHGESDEDRRKSARQALVEFEKVLDLDKDPPTRFYLLGEVAKAAFDAGDDEKARKYANELLTTNSELRLDWNSGNAVHQGNLILGRIALKAGDTEKAKHYLLEAGKTEGSPQLNSFGPNMMLAKELLEKGETAVVLEYFALFSKFWNRDELKQWAATVQGGGMPEFRANLVY
jgi:tetratricopeptide (TPR) repeat protein